MNPINSAARRRRGALVRWAVVLAFPAALIAGCGDDGSGGPQATQPPATATAPPPSATPTPVNTAAPTATAVNTSAGAACEKLARCGQCFSDSTGHCIATAACAQRLATDVVLCINAGTACGADMLGDCLFPGCDGTDASGECQ